MKTILFLTEVLAGTHVAKLEGVYESARRYGWHVVEAEFENSRHSLAEYISTWHPDGCIVVGSALTAPLSPRSLSELPTVYLDPDEKTRRAGKAYVASDPRPLAELAARELMALNCASYAFVGWSERTAWSEDRRRAFADIIRGTGLPFTAFAGHFSPKDKISFQRQLRAWLMRLPKPCGIFTANDTTAAQVIDACQRLKLDVPTDVAVVGVDNQEIVCENAPASITSIEIDFRAAGRLSAEALAELMSNPSRTPEPRLFGPGRIVRRQSTRRLLRAIPVVERALEKIRREACFGLTAADVVAEMKLPRRGAERRFRQATGSSILEEINRHRLERAFSLLRRPGYPIALIAQQCGWSNDVFLKRLFKRTTGLTMREWRKREGDQRAHSGQS